MPVLHATQSRLSSSRLHAGTRVVQPRRCLQRPRYSCTPRAGLTEVGRYLAEAASCMLQPQADTVPWSGGRLDHWQFWRFLSCLYKRCTAASSACPCTLVIQDLRQSHCGTGKASAALCSLIWLVNFRVAALLPLFGRSPASDLKDRCAGPECWP